MFTIIMLTVSCTQLFCLVTPEWLSKLQYLISLLVWWLMYKHHNSARITERIHAIIMRNLGKMLFSYETSSLSFRHLSLLVFNTSQRVSGTFWCFKKNMQSARVIISNNPPRLKDCNLQDCSFSGFSWQQGTCKLLDIYFIVQIILCIYTRRQMNLKM